MKQQQEEGSLLVCELELRDTLHCSGDQRWQRVYISMAYSKSASIDMLTVNRYMQFYDHTLYVNAMFQLGYLTVMPYPVLLCACFCGTLPCLLIQIHARASHRHRHRRLILSPVSLSTACLKAWWQCREALDWHWDLTVVAIIIIIIGSVAAVRCPLYPVARCPCPSSGVRKNSFRSLRVKT